MVLFNVLLILVLMLLVMVKSPFILSLGLILLVFLLGFMIHFMGSLWLMYTLVIMFLGGMMIVFTYASSISNVFKLRLNMKKIFVLSLFYTSFMFFLGQLYADFTQNIYSTPVYMLFYPTAWPLIILLSFVLLMSLFIVVKMVQIEQGPLKL